jgi:hypothetical protein
MTPAEFKPFILAHCLRIAKVDPEYANWAAAWYERNQPELLKNLHAKVEQEIKRSSASPSPSEPATASTRASTGKRGRGA